MPHLSVVIPVYNGAATIGTVVNDCFAALSHLDFELLLVNDGSRDNSEAILFELAAKHPNVKAISLTKNFGEFNAVMCGLNFAEGEYTAIIDDDGQNPPKEILKLLAEAEYEEYDVVYAEYEQKMHSWWRNIGSSLANLTVWFNMFRAYGTYLSSFKILKKPLVKQMVKYTNANVYPDVLVLKYAKGIGQVKVEHKAGGKSRYTFSKLVKTYSSILITRYGFIGYLVYYIHIITALFFVALPLIILSGKSDLIMPNSGWVFVGLGLLISMILPGAKIDRQYAIKKNIILMLNNPEEYNRMAAVEADHWWYRVLHERMINSPGPSPEGRGGVKILDAGCGTGGLLLKLKALGYTNISGADLSPTAIEICKQRGLNVIQSDVRELPQKLNGQMFDVIICNDVLCYFTLDEIPSVLEGLKSLLKPGGLLIMNNPAHASFSGTHDRAVGIVTRFKPSALKQQIVNCQLSIVNCTQWPFLLSPLIYLVRKFQKKTQSDIDMPPQWLNSLLYTICKFEMKLFKSAPWGSSVFVVARK